MAACPCLPCYPPQRARFAFTIEFDNEFESTKCRIARRTMARPLVRTRFPGWCRWSCGRTLCASSVKREPLTRELQAGLRTPAKSMRIWLTRMWKWWGYIVVESNGTVRPTPGGRKAIEVWRTLESLIEKRSRERFGDDTIDHLRQSLLTIVSQVGVALPDALPILGYGLCRAPGRKAQSDVQRAAAATSNTASSGFPPLAGSCSPSPSTLSGNPRCRLPSAPTSCVSRLRKGSR